VLYSHFSFYEEADFKSFNEKRPIQDSRGLALLKKQLPGLRELLTSPGYEGLLVLFYARGLQKFMHAVQERMPAERMTEQYPELKFSAAFSNEVQKLLAAEGLEERVRFITPLDLGVILARVNVIAAEAFQHFVLGKDTGIRYDTPKIPEAILRLRLLGSGVPVFRLDQDVIFREDEQGFDELALFKAIACSVLAYEHRLRDPTVSTFVFSASYDTRALLGQKKASDAFEAWGWAFATRVHPALTVDLPEIKRICRLPDKKQKPDDVTKNDAWKIYAATHLDEKLVRAYYGLGATGLDVDSQHGLMTVGAHPAFAVISGAFLCLSEGAIIDLPPFSNFRENVMWIDDHLKYSLHREMHHFTSGEKLNLPAGLEYARLDKVMVTKARPGVGDLIGYTLAVYLPTLLWGAILDRWIVTNSILKVRFDSLKQPDLQAAWRDAQKQMGTGILPAAMLEALHEGRFTREDELRKQLMETAVERVEQVRQLWSGLRDGTKRTLASYWAAGEVAGVLPEQCFDPERHDHRLWQGIAPGRALDKPLRRSADLGDILEPVEDLVTDTVDYIKWTMAWPQFVQIVRSIRQGTFRGDMSWRPPQQL